MGYYCSCCILREAVRRYDPLMDAMPSGLKPVSFFCYLSLFCIALYIYFSGRAMGAVGNAAELPGWLARVHEVLIDMFDTLFFA